MIGGTTFAVGNYGSTGAAVEVFVIREQVIWTVAAILSFTTASFGGCEVTCGIAGKAGNFPSAINRDAG